MSKIEIEGKEEGVQSLGTVFYFRVKGEDGKETIDNWDERYNYVIAPSLEKALEKARRLYGDKVIEVGNEKSKVFI